MAGAEVSLLSAPALLTPIAGPCGLLLGLSQPSEILLVPLLFN